MQSIPIGKRTLAKVGTAIAGAALVASSFLPSVALASSHREAPGTLMDPTADSTDVYAFTSPDNPGTVTIVTNWIPFEIPSGGPNFYPWSPDVLYEIHIDNQGNAKSDITYQFRFQNATQNPNTFLYNTGQIGSLTDPNFNFRQTYTVTRVDNNGSTVIASNVPGAPDNVGTKSIPNYDAVANAAIVGTSNGDKVFAGQRADSFFIDLGATFDLVNVAPPGKAVNTLAGLNVKTIAIQVPKNQLTADGSAATDATNTNSIIGVWATASRMANGVVAPPGQSMAGATAGSNFVQVSRLGSPLVNEVVIPIGKKDAFNASQPANDAQFLSFVTDPGIAAIENLLFKVGAPTTGRDDLVAVFLTGLKGVNQPTNVTPAEELRLNMAIPPTTSNQNRLGLLGGDKDGYPDGRRLGDDVVDIDLQAVCGLTYALFHSDFTPNAACKTLGDNINGPDKPFLSSFPYAASPYAGDPTMPGGVGVLAGSGH